MCWVVADGGLIHAKWHLGIRISYRSGAGLLGRKPGLCSLGAWAVKRVFVCLFVHFKGNCWRVRPCCPVHHLDVLILSYCH